VFGGAVVSHLMGWNFYIGAGLWGFLSALLIDAAARRRRIGSDAAIGIITTSSFALGVALISRGRGFTRNFEAALFGNILGVTAADLWVIGTVAVAVAVFVFLAYKQLLFATFDPEVAPVYGVPSRLIDALFSLALAATIVASMNVVGVTLIAATIVIPPVTARLLSDRFSRVLLGSSALGASIGVAGMYLSYHFNIASGASIVLLGAAVFMLALTYSATRRRSLPALAMRTARPASPPAPELLD
jgi:ABC-type Mn2+/Zn2+ transport system permease subunit